MNPGTTLLTDVLLLGIAGLIILHTLSLVRRKRLLLLDPLYAFWGGIIIVYIVQPLSYGRIFIEWHSEEIVEATLGWTLLGLLCVVWGYEWNLGARLGLKLPEAPARLSPVKLTIAGCGFLFLGAMGYLYLFASAGGVNEWLAIGRGGTDYENISGYVAQLADLLPLGVILLLFQMHFHPASLPKKIALWCLATLIWWWFLYLGSRSRLIGFTIAGMSAYYLPQRKSPPLALAGAIFLALFILSNFQGAYRDKFTNLSLNLDQIDLREARENVLPSFLGGNPAFQEEAVTSGMEFNCVLSVVELVPDKVPYNYGYGYLELFTRWIPRAIWPDKFYPQMEAVQGVLREAGLSQANVRDTDLLMGPAFTFVGHWFYVGGPVALILGGLFTGVLFRTIRTLYDRENRSEGDILIYASLIGLGFGEAASTPLAWLSTLPFILGPLIFIVFLCRAPSGKGSAQGAPLPSPCGNGKLRPA
jgi:hypothetical protein